MENGNGSFVSHLVTEVLPNLLEVSSDPEYMKEFLSGVKERVQQEGLPYVTVSPDIRAWTLTEELKKVADAHPDKYNYTGALVASQILGLGAKAALSSGKPGVALGLKVASAATGKVAAKAAPYAHGSLGNPTQTVTQYRKAFRAKSGESSAAMRKRLEARIPALLAAGKLKEG